MVFERVYQAYSNVFFNGTKTGFFLGSFFFHWFCDQMDFVFSKIHLVAKSMENFFSTWIAQGWIVTSSSAVNQVLRQTWVLNSNASDVFINLFYQYRKAIVESAAQEAADAIGNRREIWVTLNLWWDFDLLYSIPTFTHRSPERNKKSVGDRDPNRWKCEENWQNMWARA